MMIFWAQQEMQRRYNASGARCDLYPVPGVGHSSLFPKGNVSTTDGVPVLDHSYAWLSSALGLTVV